jgi:hypothetical protein
MLIGVTFLAAGWGRVSRLLRGLLVLACVADFGLGVVLQEHVEHFDLASSSALNHRAIDSWHIKQLHGFVFLGDELADLALLFLVVQCACVMWLLYRTIARRA